MLPFSALTCWFVVTLILLLLCISLVDLVESQGSNPGYHSTKYNTIPHRLPTPVDIRLNLKLSPEVSSWTDLVSLQWNSSLPHFDFWSQVGIRSTRHLDWSSLFEGGLVLYANRSHNKLQDKVIIKMKFIYYVKYKVQILFTGVMDNGLVLIVAVLVLGSWSI